MTILRLLFILALAITPVTEAETKAVKDDDTPADHLPPHIRQVTWFGERADWSHDGKRILFSDYPGYKASNPVVSDDGRFIAFQMARSSEAAGVGHGIFVLDLSKVPSKTR